MSARPLGWAELGYTTGDAIFLAHGRYYVEMLSSADSSELFAMMVELGKDFVAKPAGTEDSLPVLRLLFFRSGPFKEAFSGAIMRRLCGTA